MLRAAGRAVKFMGPCLVGGSMVLHNHIPIYYRAYTRANCEGGNSDQPTEPEGGNTEDKCNENKKSSYVRTDLEKCFDQCRDTCEPLVKTVGDCCGMASTFPQKIGDNLKYLRYRAEPDVQHTVIGLSALVGVMCAFKKPRYVKIAYGALGGIAAYSLIFPTEAYQYFKSTVGLFVKLDPEEGACGAETEMHDDKCGPSHCHCPISKRKGRKMCKISLAGCDDSKPAMLQRSVVDPTPTPSEKICSGPDPESKKPTINPPPSGAIPTSPLPLDKVCKPDKKELTTESTQPELSEPAQITPENICCTCGRPKTKAIVDVTKSEPAASPPITSTSTPGATCTLLFDVQIPNEPKVAPITNENTTTSPKEECGPPKKDVPAACTEPTKIASPTPLAPCSPPAP